MTGHSPAPTTLPMAPALPAPPGLGQALRRFRQLRGWKQDRLARALGVGQPMISRWEAGLNRPDEAHAAAIQALLATHVAPPPAALLTLVQASLAPVHLICDATHRLYAASPARQREWARDWTELRGQSLWRNACPEIVAQEQALKDAAWHGMTDARRAFRIADHQGPDLIMRQGEVVWERMVLADGTALRLVTTTGGMGRA